MITVRLADEICARLERLAEATGVSGAHEVVGHALAVYDTLITLEQNVKEVNIEVVHENGDVDKDNFTKVRRRVLGQEKEAS